VRLRSAWGPSRCCTLCCWPGAWSFTTDLLCGAALVFPGGEHWPLAVIGHRPRRLAMVGACPLASALALILEEGLAMAMLRHIVAAIRTVAWECGVPVVTRPTPKVVEAGQRGMAFVHSPPAPWAPGGRSAPSAPPAVQPSVTAIW